MFRRLNRLPLSSAYADLPGPLVRLTGFLQTGIAAALKIQDIGSRAWLQLSPGSRFGQLRASRILLGTGTMPVHWPLPDLERWQPPITARPWGDTGWRIGHSLEIPDGQRVSCALDVRGQLSVQGYTLMERDARASDSLKLGSGCLIHGSLTSHGDIFIGPASHVRGSVVAAGRLLLAPGVVIGSIEKPVDVCADEIEAEGPVVIHGHVHAYTRGIITHLKTLHETECSTPAIPNCKETP